MRLKYQIEALRELSNQYGMTLEDLSMALDDDTLENVIEQARNYMEWVPEFNDHEPLEWRK